MKSSPTFGEQNVFGAAHAANCAVPSFPRFARPQDVGSRQLFFNERRDPWSFLIRA